MNGFFLSYPETRPHGFSPGNLLCDMIGGLFCEVFFDFIAEVVFEILFAAL